MKRQSTDPLRFFTTAGAYLSLIAAALFLSYSVAVDGLRDGDICWLLATGRYIVEHTSLPEHDLFSYTMPTTTPWIVYQWLSEVVFYLAYRLGNCIGLIVFAALVLSLMLIVLPLAFSESTKCPRPLTLFMVALSLLSACRRIFVRPEMFGNLFLTLLVIAVLLRRRKNKSIKDGPVAVEEKGEQNKQNIDWIFVGASAAIMILWCNFHVTFVLGIALLLYYAIMETVESFLFKPSGDNQQAQTRLLLPWLFPLTEWLAVFAGIAITLLNPRGVGLWLYLPSEFFNHLSLTIAEMQPLALIDFQAINTQALVLLMAVGIFSMWKRFFGSGQHYLSVLKETGLFLPSFMWLTTLGAFTSRRLVVIAGLIVLFTTLEIWRSGTAQALSSQLRSKGKKAKEKQEPDKRGESGSATCTRHQGLALNRWPFCLSVFVFVILSTLFFLQQNPPAIPSNGPPFNPPLKALEYIANHQPDGNVFNDAEFGDDMIWHLNARPPVFIDTRFDFYERDVYPDYLHIYACAKDWKQVMEKYRINWVFIPPNAILVKYLKQDGGWQLRYQDEHAVIYGRKPPSATN